MLSSSADSVSTVARTSPAADADLVDGEGPTSVASGGAPGPEVSPSGGEVC